MTDTLPIFPLTNVLFPQGRMSLRIFEARYMDMIAHCMRGPTNFGICLIAEGQEVGAPAVPHKVGVEARIVDWDMSQPGVLGLTVRGERRFAIEAHDATPQGVVVAQVRWLEQPEPASLDERFESMLPLMRAVIADAGTKVIAPPHRLDDADWVGYRYAEILPIPALARQRLLELDDATLRLEIIQQFLAERGLIEA
ncbi:LON peptidase substrate-binding domain-containing protein [Uliginosibacterium sp. sgz301328]|uniref:LON peptidase substrate-binding domain-containing protein n=1 Tax=Uliginosibacterium sp. sgz301328 TaxID=3243764 RepID=UPI00359EB822